MTTRRLGRSVPSAAAACLLAAALAALSAGAQANDALAKKSGCLSCHAVSTKLVGPAYQDVAAKYAGQADALPTLVKNIREGGSGKWGDIPMPAQSQLSEADAKRLATWILGGAK